MQHEYAVTGMTCNGCVASVTENLAAVDGVAKVVVDLQQSSATITMSKPVPLGTLAAALPGKYTIKEKEDATSEISIPKQGSKLQQLRPLFLIFAYLFVAAFLLNFREWDAREAMLDFMGLFYIVFSFFKFLDLQGFPKSFRMYDPLAKAVPFYGWLYPFLELALGLMFLMRFKVQWALLATVVILGITTVGVTKSLLDKKAIRCACLGTALNLPMTEATFIENAIMLIMAGVMLF